MFKDMMRVVLVMMFDGAAYSHDIFAQRIEMSIAIYGALPLLPFGSIF